MSEETEFEEWAKKIILRSIVEIPRRLIRLTNEVWTAGYVAGRSRGAKDAVNLSHGKKAKTNGGK